MKLLLNVLLFFIASILTAQTNEETSLSLETYLQKNALTPQTTPQGLHFILNNKGSGASAKTGDYVKVKYRVALLDSTLIDETSAAEPFVFQLGYSFEFAALDMGVTLLKKGGAAQLFVPPPLAYKSGVDNARPLLVNVELLDILDFKAYDDYMRALEARERHAFEQQQKTQFQTDLKLINDYTAEQKIKTKSTSSGLSYTITKSGRGAYPQAGDLVKVQYEGFLLDGTSFDKTSSNQPFEFQLGRAKVIEGLEEGLTFFNKGSEGWLFIPSKLAYGPMPIQEGRVSIPANAVLFFKLKLVSIEKK